jgi:hypothetical protein
MFRDLQPSPQDVSAAVYMPAGQVSGAAVALQAGSVAVSSNLTYQLQKELAP